MKHQIFTLYSIPGNRHYIELPVKKKKQNMKKPGMVMILLALTMDYL